MKCILPYSCILYVLFSDNDDQPPEVPVHVGEVARFSVIVPSEVGGGLPLSDCDLAIKVETPEGADGSRPLLEVHKPQHLSAEMEDLIVDGHFSAVSVGESKNV